MKRLNPETGLEFKFGDVREDGKVFISYRTTKPLRKSGTFYEDWISPEFFASRKLKNKNWLIKNADRVKELQDKWVKNNSERVKKLQKNWYHKNKDKCVAKVAKRKAAKLKRTPEWLNDSHLEEIAEFYTVAKLFQMYTGESYHVDHIVPLQGKTVSGLHVPWNLQVISAKDNLNKGNKYGV